MKEREYHSAITESAMADHEQIFLAVKKYNPEPAKKVKYQLVLYSKLYKTMEEIDYSNIGASYTY